MDPRPQIRQFLGSLTAGFEIRDDDDLFAMSFLNSLAAMQLVSFVESTFQLTVTDDDLDLDNFRSVNCIAGLVIRKSGG